MEEKCHNICIEPTLQALSGRTFQNKSNIHYSALNEKGLETLRVVASHISVILSLLCDIHPGYC